MASLTKYQMQRLEKMVKDILNEKLDEWGKKHPAPVLKHIPHPKEVEGGKDRKIAKIIVEYYRNHIEELFTIIETRGCSYRDLVEKNTYVRGAIDDMYRKMEIAEKEYDEKCKEEYRRHNAAMEEWMEKRKKPVSKLMNAERVLLEKMFFESKDITKSLEGLRTLKID